jgi:hypothetical protein
VTNYLVRTDIKTEEQLRQMMEPGLTIGQKIQFLDAFRAWVGLNSQLLAVTDDFQLVPAGTHDMELYALQAFTFLRTMAVWGQLDWKEYVPEEFQEVVAEQMDWEGDINELVWGESWEGPAEVDEAEGFVDWEEA